MQTGIVIDERQTSVAMAPGPCKGCKGSCKTCHGGAPCRSQGNSKIQDDATSAATLYRIARKA